MKAEKSNQKPGRVEIQQTNGGLHFAITEEVWRDVGKGKIHCVATGETMAKSKWKQRGRGTFLKVTLPS